MSEIAPHVIFGTRMKRMREGRGWSQRELGRRAGINGAPNLMSRVESGHSCSLDSCVAIARALSTTLGAMLAPWKCDHCLDCPPPGFTCQACGAEAASGPGRGQP